MNNIKKYLLIICMVFGMISVTGCGSSAATDNNGTNNVSRAASVTTEAQNKASDEDKQTADKKAELESIQAQIDEAKRQAEEAASIQASKAVEEASSREQELRESQAAAEEAASKAVEEAKSQAAEIQSSAQASAAQAIQQYSQQEQQPVADDSDMVWIPKSGKKYHSNPSCSNMKSPSQVTIDTAQARGYTPCSKCY